MREETLETDSKPQPPKLQLSATQIIASVLAAMTATVVASFFGVNGTIIGAAVASAVTVTGNAVYSHSLRRTGQEMRKALPPVVARRALPSDVRRVPLPGTPAAHDAVAAAPGRETWWGARIAWRRLALAGTGLFLAVAAVVTGIELAAGRPLGDLLRNESGSGTTFLGGTSSQAPTHRQTPSNQPSPAQSSTPTSQSTQSTSSAPSTAAQQSPSSAGATATPTSPGPSGTETVSPHGGATGSVPATP